MKAAVMRFLHWLFDTCKGCRDGCSECDPYGF
jgi:hypothetical protein